MPKADVFGTAHCYSQPSLAVTYLTSTRSTAGQVTADFRRIRWDSFVPLTLELVERRFTLSRPKNIAVTQFLDVWYLYEEVRLW